MGPVARHQLGISLSDETADAVLLLTVVGSALYSLESRQLTSSRSI